MLWFTRASEFQSHVEMWELSPVCKVAKKKSTSTAVAGGGETNTPSSSSAAAVMKKKKKKKKKNNNNKKGRLIKCNICLHQYTSQNLDKHVHGRSHHEAIERLKGGEQMHKCWACDVSVPGLEHFRKHIETVEHKHKLLSLKKRRQSGFTVDYSNDELNALCAQRDRNRSMLKQQKNKEKLKKLKERMAANFQEAFNWRSRMKDQDWRTLGKGFGPPGPRSRWSDDKSVACPVNNENKQGRINAEPGLGSISNERAQTIGWNNFCLQTSKSITWSLKKDVDFTSDPLAQSRKEEGESRQSQRTSREQDKDVLGQKRSRDAHTSDSPSVKKQCLRDVPSMKPRLTPSVCGEKVESERTSQSVSAPAPLCAPELVQCQMEHLCVMLKNIRKSLDEERLPVGSSQHPDPELRPATGDGLKRTEHGKETPLPDSPQFVEAGKTKTKSSPCKQVNSLPASGADPQEKPEATQTRNVLPTLLSRSVSKTEANKPNLKVARGIRTSQKPSQASESRVLKPALQKLISSKSSQWRINWEEIYQEATHRKLQREKGMPRFGIELVSPLPPDPQGLVAEDLAHLELDEGFQWASVECDAVTLPRSVSPSSKDSCSFPPAEAYPAERHDHGKTTETTNRTSWPVEQERRDVGENRSTSAISRSAEFVTDRLENRDLNDDNTSENRALGRRQNLTPLDSLVCVKTEKSDNYCTEQDKPDHDRIHSIPDMQIKQEKQDFPNATTHIKNPPKSQVSELLVMSLREDELCSSLEDVDSRLLRAQAALQSAFLQVQHLQMIKQQVTAEMSSLRSKRIGILQRIKNSGLDRTSAAGSLGSAVRTPRRAASPSRQHQHQDAVPDRSEGHTDGDDQRRTDLAPVSESRKTHSESPESTVTHTRQLGAQAQPNTSL